MGSTPPLWGLWGDGLEAQGTGGRKEASPTFPPPQARKVKDTSRQHRSQTGLGPGTLDFRGVVVVQALAGCRHFPPSQARQRGPQSEVCQSFQMRQYGHSSAHWGLVESSPRIPTCPLSHLVQGYEPQSRTKPQRISLPGRWQGEGGGSWSLWHLQGRHLRLHREVLVESDHCVPARRQERELGARGKPCWGTPTRSKASHQLSPSRSV